MPATFDLNSLFNDPQVTALLRIVLAGLLGGLVGLERELAGKAAGIRTYGLVGVGAAIFTVVPIVAFGADKGSGVIGFIISGIGFLGAGAILHTRRHVVGLTTAAGMWVAAGLGMAIGLGLYVLGLGAALLLFLMLQFASPEELVRSRRRRSGLGTTDPEDDFMVDTDDDPQPERAPQPLSAASPPMSAWPTRLPAPPSFGPWSTGAQQPRPPQANGGG